MTRTTPPRQLNIESVFPELQAYRRSAVRLHPRRGEPEVTESSVGGPLLWPAEEPWPTCAVPHKKGTGNRLADVRQKREILDRAWSRTPNPGPTNEEVAVITSFKRGRHAPSLNKTDPIPMLPVGQFRASDIPDHVPPAGQDLLQVLWCPFEAHGEGHDLSVHLQWRSSEKIQEVLSPQPEPEVVGRPELVPSPCVVHPEAIVEHEYFHLLDEELQERISAWEGPEGSESPQYMSDLSIAPGWKLGGYISFSLTGPQTHHCSCGSDMRPLLTIDDTEWDNGSLSWVPEEDQGRIEGNFANMPTSVYAGRGRLIILACLSEVTHPHRLVSQ